VTSLLRESRGLAGFALVALVAGAVLAVAVTTHPEIQVIR
jgi:hypothetical protein